MLKNIIRGQLYRATLGNRYYGTAAEDKMVNEIAIQLSEIKSAGMFKHERVLTTSQRSQISVEGSKHPVLNFCANNYLGFSDHPDVVQAGIDALKSYAAGMSSVRFICGTNDLHIRLEKLISQFHDREDTILFPSCFDANAGLFEVLLGAEDEVFTDELNHASIIDGIRLSKAKRHIYKHRDMQDLESKLKSSEDTDNRKLIVTDGVFSMDGTISPLREICELADKYNAVTMIDECHATGFLGDTGRGTEEFLDVMGKVTIINSTLGKALGGASGGYTTGPQEIVTLLRQKARPYLFSNAMPPAVVGCAIKIFEMLMNESKYPKKLHANTIKFRKEMTAAGFQLGGDPNHPICPIMLGDEKLTHEFASKMLEHGIYVIGFSFPVVGKGKARIRVQISAAHSNEEIECAVQAFCSVGRELKVIN